MDMMDFHIFVKIKYNLTSFEDSKLFLDPSPQGLAPHGVNRAINLENPQE